MSPSTRHGSCQAGAILGLPRQKNSFHTRDTDEHLISALHKPISQELTPQIQQQMDFGFEDETVLASHRCLS